MHTYLSRQKGKSVNSIPYFNSDLDQRFIDILDVAIVGNSDSDKDLNVFKSSLEQLLMDYCVEDFLGYFNSSQALFHSIDNENTDADMQEIKTFYLTSLNPTKSKELFVGEFFVKQIIDDSGADQIHAFITIYPIQHSINFTIASCLSYIASMYANFDMSVELSQRQQRFKNYISTFNHLGDSQFQSVFDKLEFDSNLVANAEI